MTHLFSRLVGPEGKVYAVDINASLLGHIVQRDAGITLGSDQCRHGTLAHVRNARHVYHRDVHRDPSDDRYTLALDEGEASVRQRSRQSVTVTDG